MTENWRNKFFFFKFKVRESSDKISASSERAYVRVGCSVLRGEVFFFLRLVFRGVRFTPEPRILKSFRG